MACPHTLALFQFIIPGTAKIQAVINLPKLRVVAPEINSGPQSSKYSKYYPGFRHHQVSRQLGMSLGVAV